MRPAVFALLLSVAQELVLAWLCVAAGHIAGWGLGGRLRPMHQTAAAGPTGQSQHTSAQLVVLWISAVSV